MKTKNTTSNLKKGYCILFLALPFLAMAQPEGFPGGATNTIDNQAPIDNYILLALLLGVYFAYRFFKTQYAINTKK
jgi:hypothetical protein